MSSIKELKADKIKYRNDPIKLIEIINLLGYKYRESGHYQDAIDEHRQAIAMCKNLLAKKSSKTSQTNEIKLELAISYRALGECYSEIDRHQDAIEQHELYLQLALDLNDLIEIQRSYATIGRTYLLWGQNDTDDHDQSGQISFDKMMKAERAFRKAMDLCEQLRTHGKLKPKEYAEMKSRLLLNRGLVNENLGKFGECRKLIENSIQLTKSNYLFDELYRCQISMGSILEKIDSIQLDDNPGDHRQRPKQSEAIFFYEEALKTADQLRSRRKKFDCFISLGLAWIKRVSINSINDEDPMIMQRTKQYLRRAFELRVSNQDDRERIEQLLKIVIAIELDLRKYRSLINNDDDPINLDQRIELCDRLGDHFVWLKCYRQAIECYEQELKLAIESNRSNQFVSKIYVSIGQTYLDLGLYERSLEYFQNELTFHHDNVVEQTKSMIQILEIKQLMYRLMVIDDDNDSSAKNIDSKTRLREEIIENYESTIQLHCQDDQSKSKSKKLLTILLKNFLGYLESINMLRFRQDELRERLQQLSNDQSADDNDPEDDDEDQQPTTNPYDHINIEDYLDLDDSNLDDGPGMDDEEMPANMVHGRKRSRRPSTTMKRLNEFGETPLHQACIAGNYEQCERLLKLNSYDINAKDNCGWTALHEACNHGHLSIVELLLKYGANLESNDKRNDYITPLHDACNCGHFRIIRLLMNKYDANLMAKTATNETPVECLINWRRRCSNELSAAELNECRQLEAVMIETMKSKGYNVESIERLADDSQAFGDRSSVRSAMNSNSQSNRTSARRPQLLKRNLTKDSIYSKRSNEDGDEGPVLVATDDTLVARKARQEYRQTIESLKPNHHRNHSIGAMAAPPSSKSAALIDDSVQIPRNDWLINDLPSVKRKRASNYHRYDDGHDDYDDDDDQPDYIDVMTPDTLHGRHSVNSKKFRSSSRDDDSMTEPSIQLSSASSSVESRGSKVAEPVNTSTIPRASSVTDSSISDHQSGRNPPSSIQSINHSIMTTTTANVQRKSIVVNFDDKSNSSFLIQIRSDEKLTFGQLKSQLIRRYFVHYGRKPEIKLQINNAIILDDDLVNDIVDSDQQQLKIQAIIERFTVEQTDQRYRELCGLNQLKIDRNLEISLRKSYKNQYLSLENVHFECETQLKLMFRSLLQQNLRELNLSNTNILLQPQQSSTESTFDQLIQMLQSLNHLERLLLANVSLTSNHLLKLLNINSISSLKLLDLSFNPLSNDSSYSIAQLILSFKHLQLLNLCGCDLTDEFFAKNSGLLLQSIQNSNNLQTIQLQFNDIADEMIEKFKSLKANH